MFMALYLILLSILLVFLTFTTFYLVYLAVNYYVKKEVVAGDFFPVNRFAIIVPAHNEELLIKNLCNSISEIDYPVNKRRYIIIADNCDDKTAEIGSEFDVNVLERFDKENIGKGYALSWSLQQINIDQYDAILFVDADNYVDKNILIELNKHINRGEQAIQCYNAVGNRNDSWFTQLLFVSRVIGNHLYHEAKYRLGLSSYLMGNGLCFKASLLKQKGWTAFSTGEDWEYYAQLIEDGVAISFAAGAKVFHQESRSLDQATSQRLRWSSGKFNIAKTLGISLLKKGIRQRSWFVIDAAFPLIFPNYSLLVNLTGTGLVLSLFVSINNQQVIIYLFLLLLLLQVLLFVLGSIIAKDCKKIFLSVLYVPVFLIWKGFIDLCCVLGLHKEKKWIRTKRHVNDE